MHASNRETIYSAGSGDWTQARLITVSGSARTVPIIHSDQALWLCRLVHSLHSTVQFSSVQFRSVTCTRFTCYYVMCGTCVEFAIVSRRLLFIDFPIVGVTCKVWNICWPVPPVIVAYLLYICLVMITCNDLSVMRLPGSGSFLLFLLHRWMNVRLCIRDFVAGNPVISHRSRHFCVCRCAIRCSRCRYKPSLYVTSHPGQLSLAIPPRVGKMSTGDDYGHRQGRNGEFCVTCYQDCWHTDPVRYLADLGCMLA